MRSFTGNSLFQIRFTAKLQLAKEEPPLETSSGGIMYHPKIS